MTSENSHYIFECEEHGNLKKLLFDTEKYFDTYESIALDSQKLLHLHLEYRDYYLLIWYGMHNSSNYFQYNKGDEFTNFLKNNGVSYLRFDVAEVLENYGPKLKLTNGQTIEFETFANGTYEGLDIYNVTQEKKTVVFSSALGKLKLKKINQSVELSWKGSSKGDELPKPFKELLEQKRQKGSPFVTIIFIVIIIAVLYWIYS